MSKQTREQQKIEWRKKYFPTAEDLVEELRKENIQTCPFCKIGIER